MNLVLCIVDNGGRHRQSGKSKSFDVFQNCSQFTEKLGKEENEGQVDVLLRPVSSHASAPSCARAVLAALRGGSRVIEQGRFRLGRALPFCCWRSPFNCAS